MSCNRPNAAPKGRILKVKMGYNPNSSSIGTNLTPFLLTGAFVAMALPLLYFAVGKRLSKNRPKETESMPPKP